MNKEEIKEYLKLRAKLQLIDMKFDLTMSPKHDTNNIILAFMILLLLGAVLIDGFMHISVYGYIVVINIMLDIYTIFNMKVHERYLKKGSEYADTISNIIDMLLNDNEVELYNYLSEHYADDLKIPTIDPTKS